MTEEELKCPKCGNTENFHFNYTYGKVRIELEEILCNECGTFFKTQEDEFKDTR